MGRSPDARWTLIAGWAQIRTDLAALHTEPTIMAFR
jgi:hypothetical protein